MPGLSVAVAVGVRVGVCVLVDVDVLVGVGVLVDVDVLVGVGVLVDVDVLVGVFVAGPTMLVAVGVGVGVGVCSSDVQRYNDQLSNVPVLPATRSSTKNAHAPLPS